LQHYKFPSIEQFRHAVKTVRDHCAYYSLPLPSVDFIGTVKLHGTNASVVYDAKTGDTQPQSRERIITIGNDNAGFALSAATHAEKFSTMFSTLQQSGQHDVIAIYGEWCGQGIQKGVAVSQVQKMFVVFGIKMITNGDETWMPIDQINEIVGDYPGIYSIGSFKTYHLTIDFSNPELSQNELVRLTNDVEQECPVGKHFGVSGVGEGIVWSSTNFTKKLVFKVKGEKHSDSKVKTLAEVDVEKMQSIQAYANTVVTDHRLEKMLATLIETGGQAEQQFTSDFIRLVFADVIKEESDRLIESGFTWKQVSPKVATNARNWWMKRLDELARAA